MWRSRLEQRATELEEEARNLRATAKMPSFMHLPPEIREMILEYCLVVSTPISPHPAHYEAQNVCNKDDHKPDIALLRVNKTINTEAGRVFYGKNTFRLTTAFRPRFWANHGNQIRQIAMSLDPADLNTQTLKYISEYWHKRYPGVENLTARSESLHNARLDIFQRVCRFKIDLLQRMRLEACTIDVSSLYCPNGCCREEAIRGVCVPLRDRAHDIEGEIELADKSTTGIVTIVGAQNEEECALIANLFGLSPSLSPRAVKMEITGS